MPKDNSDFDKAAEISRKKAAKALHKENLAEIKAQQRINRAGSPYTNRDRNANFKIKKVKRNFVGNDNFTRQKGRGFIDTKVNFTVRWTPAKLILVTLFVVIPYIGLTIAIYNIGLKIVAGILIAVALLILFIALLARWVDKNT